jgi:hypothetical protein
MFALVRQEEQTMYIGIERVYAHDDYVLSIVFHNGERRVFDVKPYLSIDRFKELREPAVFSAVRVSFDTIAWPNELDMDPEAVYQASVPA